MTVELRVVATAGHVDHGKSSLIQRLTGIDPDRWAEEKRRGLTIDLGFAWTELPSGREVGFVDVPGHERFIRNMLAGVGPVRLVLFVVAADEGWKPQSEEHLQILDVLGVDGAVIAITKRDLVDDETLAIATDEVADAVAGTALAGAPIVPVSARTGEGLPGVLAALDAMLDGAVVPDVSRARLWIDRVFTITGAGTVVTGTLGGDRLETGEEVAIEPGGTRARIRSLQSHERGEVAAWPVRRVAANLANVDRRRIERGDVLAHPGRWPTVATFDAWVRPARGVAAIPPRGAFTIHAGSAQTSATLRLGEADGEGVLARLRTERPLVLEPGDRFVLREEGRAETVGGGIVLDVAPPRAFARGGHQTYLARRRGAPARRDLAALHVDEHGAAEVREVVLATGAEPPEATVHGTWAISETLHAGVGSALRSALGTFHAAHPLDPGMPIAEARAVVAAALRSARVGARPELVDVLLAADGTARDATTVRLAEHRVDLADRGEEVARLREAIGGEHVAAPPGVGDLVAAGFPADLIDAAARSGDVVRIAPDLVVHPDLVERAATFVGAHADGVTVSALREALGTSRRFAVPLLEWMDAQGRTRRVGDLRFAR